MLKLIKIKAVGLCLISGVVKPFKNHKKLVFTASLLGVQQQKKMPVV